MNRRTLLTSALFAVGAGRLPFPAWIGPAQAQEKVWRHGVSLFGDLKYPAGFKQFDYVNAAAPKGGSVREVAIGTYDSFNIVVAGVKGTPAIGVDLIYETLLTPASMRCRPSTGCSPKPSAMRRTFRGPPTGCGPKPNGTTASR